MPELVCDGVLVATPPARRLNFSARGPIPALAAKMLALTPIAPFRPRAGLAPSCPRTCGRHARLEAENRPVSAVADQFEVRDVTQVDVTLDGGSP